MSLLLHWHWLALQNIDLGDYLLFLWDFCLFLDAQLCYEAGAVCLCSTALDEQ